MGIESEHQDTFIYDFDPGNLILVDVNDTNKRKKNSFNDYHPKEVHKGRQ